MSVASRNSTAITPSIKQGYAKRKRDTASLDTRSINKIVSPEHSASKLFVNDVMSVGSGSSTAKYNQTANKKN